MKVQVKAYIEMEFPLEVLNGYDDEMHLEHDIAQSIRTLVRVYGGAVVDEEWK